MRMTRKKIIIIWNKIKKNKNKYKNLYKFIVIKQIHKVLQNQQILRMNAL